MAVRVQCFVMRMLRQEVSQGLQFRFGVGCRGSSDGAGGDAQKHQAIVSRV